MRLKYFLSIMGRFCFAITFIFLVAFPSVLLFAQQKIPNHPNIIFFLVDDMGWQDTSVPFWDSTKWKIKFILINPVYN